MAGNIFISYRRSDSDSSAGRIYDRLETVFGKDRLFMDVDTISLGVDFAEALREEVQQCRVLLAVIGEQWLITQDHEGKRRLDDPNDFVRIEIAAALRRGIPVIPILIGNARVPKAADLPDDLKLLALRNGLNVRHGSFGRDVGKLLSALQTLLGETFTPSLHPEKSHPTLRVCVGEDGQFVAIPKHNLYGFTRRLAVSVENQSTGQAVTDCKVQIIDVAPYSGAKLPRVLKAGFSLAAGDRIFIPLVQYGEAQDPKKYNCADTLIELFGEERPLPLAHDSPSIISLRVTGIGSSFVEMHCKVWVDAEGRLRISGDDADTAVVAESNRDVWLYDAICRLFLGKWEDIPMVDDHLDLSANGFQAIHRLLEHVRQLAFDGKFTIWGRHERATALWEKTAPFFWKDNQIGYHSFTAGDPKGLYAVPRDTGGEIISLRELMTSKALVDEIPTVDWSCTNNANALRIYTGTGAPFDRVETNEFGVQHTISIQVANVGSRLISSCKFYRTFIDFTDDKRKTLLDGPFALAPGERRNVSIAMFNETKQLPDVDHLIGLSMPAAGIGYGVFQPRLPPDRRHVVSYVVESPDCENAVLNCQLWVDESGSLRLREL